MNLATLNATLKPVHASICDSVFTTRKQAAADAVKVAKLFDNAEDARNGLRAAMACAYGQQAVDALAFDGDGNVTGWAWHKTKKGVVATVEGNNAKKALQDLTAHAFPTKGKGAASTAKFDAEARAKRAADSCTKMQFGRFIEACKVLYRGM